MLTFAEAVSMTCGSLLEGRWVERWFPGEAEPYGVEDS